MADLTTLDEDLREAVRAGDRARVTTLLAEGANATYRTAAGYTAVLDAVFSPETNAELIALLLDHGASIDAASKYGETALRVASRLVRIDLVRVLLQRGAAPGVLGWNDLAIAVALGSLDDVRAALGAAESSGKKRDLAQRDDWERTPWMLSLELGELDKARAIVAAGVDRAERGHAERSAVGVAAHHGHLAVLEWLLDEGFPMEEHDAFDFTPLMAATACRHPDAARLLLRHGANVHAHTSDELRSSVMSLAGDRATFEILHAAGADPSGASAKMRAIVRGTAAVEPPPVTAEAFRAGSARRFGTANPERMQVPFWDQMVVTGTRAGKVRAELGAVGAGGRTREPIWCFERYGQSLTVLPDGRVIEIGGEHEDFYDPDFCIYNDVVVYPAERDGTFAIYGYPEDVFAPTDFHSATFVDGAVIIIGGLGYAGRRAYDTTPVYRLDEKTLAIEAIPSHGDRPGWIHRHRATLDGSRLIVTGGLVASKPGEREELVANSATFALDLATSRWERRGG